MRHTAEALLPRRPAHQKLAHGWSKRHACQRSGRRTGQCSPAQGDAARLDYPRALLGCQATFRPPVGSATRSNGRCALPHLAAPRGRTRKAPAPLRSARAADFSRPQYPLTGALWIAYAPGGKRLCRACRFLGRLSAPPWASSPAGVGPLTSARLLGLPLALCGLSSLLDRLAMYCRRAPASRPGPPLRCGWPPGTGAWADL